jgi:hypothetical protein
MKLLTWILLAVAVSADTAGAGAPGRTVLVVEGAVGAAGGEPVRFDMERLRALPQARFETTTLWTDGKRVFSGVRVSDLLKAVEARGDRLRAQALNDYAVTIPVSDATPDGPIVAYAMDGAPMSVRDKGPLWIVYPYDHDDRWRNETIYARSVWQLDRIRVLEE